jgi:hypothetical protein
MQTYSESSDFFCDFCETGCTDMPWNKLNNRYFQAFVLKCNIHHEGTWKKIYLDECYRSALVYIGENLKNILIWGMECKIIDACGQYVANMLVGKLSEDELGTPDLVAWKATERTNYSMIAHFVNAFMLWLGGGNEVRLCVLVSEATVLKMFYPYLIHITHLVDRFNRIAK